MKNTIPPQPPIQRVRLDDLVEPDKNPNQMGAEEFRLLVEAVKRVGFLQPVLAREEDGALIIVDGVHRVRAAREAGLFEVPVVVGSFSVDEALALQIGMNRLRGELDLAKVAEAMAELAEEGWTREAMTLTGFSVDEVAALIDSVHSDNDMDILAGGSAPEPSHDDTEKLYVLEVPMPNVGSLRKARSKLKKLGNGDLGRGLLALLEEG